jgi:L-asparagine transporter-like permease
LLQIHIAKENKNGVPYRSMLVVLLICTLPTAFNYDIMHIVSNTNLLINTVLVITLIAFWQLPNKFPEEWKRSRIHVPIWVFRLFILLCFGLKMFFLIISASNLTTPAIVLSLGLLVVAGAIAIIRYKRGCVPDQPLPDDMTEL